MHMHVQTHHAAADAFDKQETTWVLFGDFVDRIAFEVLKFENHAEPPRKSV